MNKARLYLMITSVFILVMNHGCAERSKTEVNDPVGLDSIRINKTYHLFGDTANAGCMIQISFQYPQSLNDAEKLENIQSIFVENTFGSNFKDMSPKDAAEEYANRYIDEFKAFETKSTIDLDDYESDNGFIYYMLLDTRVVYNKNGFISFVIDKTSFEGGAHSSEERYAFVFDIENDQLLTEDNFAGDRYQKQMAPILAQKIAQSNGLLDPENLENIGYSGLDDIVPNGNFSIDDKGITYYFNENEIAGAMIGIVEVFVPYDEIRIYIPHYSPIAPLIQ